MRRAIVIFLCYSILFTSLCFSKDQREYQKDKNINAKYEECPLYFIFNQGQLNKQVHYLIQGLDKDLYFTSEGITFVFKNKETHEGSPLRAGFFRSEGNILFVKSDILKSGKMRNYFKRRMLLWLMES